jgi:hypothetical protein
MALDIMKISQPLKSSIAFGILSALSAGLPFGALGVFICIGFIYKGLAEESLLAIGGIVLLFITPITFFVAAAVMSLVPGSIAALVFLPAARIAGRLRGARVILLAHSAVCGFVGAWAAVFMWDGWRPPQSGLAGLGLILGVYAGVTGCALLLWSKKVPDGYSPLSSESKNV